MHAWSVCCDLELCMLHGKSYLTMQPVQLCLQTLLSHTELHTVVYVLFLLFYIIQQSIVGYFE